MNSARSAEALQDQHKVEPHFNINKPRSITLQWGKVTKKPTWDKQKSVKIRRFIWLKN